MKLSDLINESKKLSHVICAWCKKKMGYVQLDKDNAISHGICPECVKEAEEELKKGSYRNT